MLSAINSGKFSVHLFFLCKFRCRDIQAIPHGPPPCLPPRTADNLVSIFAVSEGFALLRLTALTVDAHADLRSADRGALPTGR